MLQTSLSDENDGHHIFSAKTVWSQGGKGRKEPKREPLLLYGERENSEKTETY